MNNEAPGRREQPRRPPQQPGRLCSARERPAKNGEAAQESRKEGDALELLFRKEDEARRQNGGEDEGIQVA
jgi:hypothetical protein